MRRPVLPRKEDCVDCPRTGRGPSHTRRWTGRGEQRYAHRLGRAQGLDRRGCASVRRARARSTGHRQHPRGAAQADRTARSFVACRLLRSWTHRLCRATTPGRTQGALRRDRADAHPTSSRPTREDRSPRRAKPRSSSPHWRTHTDQGADTRRGSDPRSDPGARGPQGRPPAYPTAHQVVPSPPRPSVSGSPSRMVTPLSRVGVRPAI